MHVTELVYSPIRCSFSDLLIPYHWIVAVVEPVIPGIKDGKLCLDAIWSTATGEPMIPPVIISAADPEEILDGIEELSPEEQEMVYDEDCFLADFWQRCVGQLSDLVPDNPTPDTPLFCDYCNEVLRLGIGQQQVFRVRPSIVLKSRRIGGGCTLEPYEDSNSSDSVLCLSCAKLIGEVIVPQERGTQKFWQML